MKALSEALGSFQLARLIPVVADSKKEERATSALLATLMSVPEYAKEIIDEIGGLTGKRMTIDCYIEVSFKPSGDEKKLRPDGLIVVTLGSKKWTALIESKVGTQTLTRAQIEEYLDLAKCYGINAVITISNQFAPIPSHHPVKVNKLKQKSVSLFHFSWLSLVTKAVILANNKVVEDPEQAYILSELIRYLNHVSSGVSSLTRMDAGWKEVCLSLQQGAVLNKSSVEVEKAVTSWLQLVKHLSLNLAMLIGEPVSIALSNKRKKDPELNFQEECHELLNKNILDVEFEIPNAASKICLTADFLRRTINFSMKLDAPKDKSRASACINWFTRQLKDKENIGDLAIRVYWPRRIPMSNSTLLSAINSPDSLIPEGVKDLPTHIEVIRIVDLMAKFKAPKLIVDECSVHLPAFYKDVGQHLNKWVPKAPKIKKRTDQEPQIPTVLSGADTVCNDSELVNKPLMVSSDKLPPFLERLTTI